MALEPLELIAQQIAIAESAIPCLPLWALRRAKCAESAKEALARGMRACPLLAPPRNSAGWPMHRPLRSLAGRGPAPDPPKEALVGRFLAEVTDEPAWDHQARTAMPMGCPARRSSVSRRASPTRALAVALARLEPAGRAHAWAPPFSEQRA